MKKLIKVGSQFSGVGAFEQSLIRLGINFENVYAADWDKYARQTYLLNFDEPEYYIKDVHDTPIKEITDKHGSLDIAMFSPPCQSFSLAGKRLGKEDKRGILFFNSLEFIQENKPRYFIFENVKGLLSHDKKDKEAEYGRTFQEWINHLGGKSVNGNETIFPYEDSVPYHIYFQVLNAKNYGIPQNRERVFIIGIRDDADNNFQFPKPYPLEKRLKDVLESEVDEKYFLSDKLIDFFNTNTNTNKEKGNGFAFKPKSEIDTANSITTKSGSRMDDNFVKIGAIRGRNPDNPKSRESGLATEQMLEINENGVSNALTTVQKDNVVVIPPTTIVEYQLTGGKWDKTHEQSGRVYDKNGISTTIHTMGGGNQEPKIIHIPTNNSKGFDTAEEEEDSINFSNPNSETRRGRVGKKVSQTLDTSCNQGIATRKPTKQELEEYEGIAVHPNSKKMEFDGFKDGNCPKILATDYKAPKCIVFNTQRIRRLTPLECFRLMDFNFRIPNVKDFVWNVSDSQAYKQAGNSICVGVLAEIIKKLNL